jgi:hypothetical protein
MKLHHFILLVVIAAVLVVSGCRQTTARNRIDESNLPRIILWAWEHPEDLEFLDPNHFGVAFLAQTLTLKKWRRGLQSSTSTAKAAATSKANSGNAD